MAKLSQAQLSARANRRALAQLGELSSRTLNRTALASVGGIANGTIFAIDDLIQQVAAGSTGQIKTALDAFSDSFNGSLRNRSAGIKSIMQEVGVGAQDSILRRYDALIHKEAWAYRRNDPGKYKRYSGGLLRKGLASPDLVRAAADGLVFNFGSLDKVAVQWYRLNFGAGRRGAGDKARIQKTMTMFGSTIQGASLDQYSRSRGFKMPPGIFLNAVYPTTSSYRSSEGGTRPPNRERRGKDAFYPLKLINRQGRTGLRSPLIPEAYKNRSARNTVLLYNKGVEKKNKIMASKDFTEGIKAAHFLDSGIGYVNANLPDRLEQLVASWVNEAVRSAQGDVRNRGPMGKFISQRGAIRARNFMRDSGFWY